MIYFKEGGWWLPTQERHLQKWMTTKNERVHGRLTYQHHKYAAAMEFVPLDRRRVAVDVGAHVGLWSWMMSYDFDHLHAFEPIPEHRDCWYQNVPHGGGKVSYSLYPFALGVCSQTVRICNRNPGSSGDTGIDPKAELCGQDVSMRTLDSFSLVNVDLLKIDCEGYELFVLQGARDTLLRCKPVCIVEQKPETGGSERYGVGVTDGIKYLESLGARVRGGKQGDYFLSW